MLTTSTRNATAPTKATSAKPSAKATQNKVRTSKAAVPATISRNTLGSFDASKVDTHKCEGACGLRLPVKKFPTITGSPRRVAECRSCRDARTAAAKGAK